MPTFAWPSSPGNSQPYPGYIRHGLASSRTSSGSGTSAGTYARIAKPHSAVSGSSIPANRATGLSAPSAAMMTSPARRCPSLEMTASTLPSPPASTAVILALTGTAPASTAASRSAWSNASRGTMIP
jgi:hypothetical protein